MKRFADYEEVLNYSPISISEVFQNQELIFLEFLGTLPNETVRLRSPFRKDNNPGCRFTYYDSLWWFVDNATYKNKLYFNCLELVMYMYDIDFKEALRLISSKVKPINNYNSSYIDLSNKKYKIDIKFSYEKWGEKNYFTNFYKVHPDYLNLQPYYMVYNYWVSTKTDPELKMNRFGMPEYKIAYYFKDTNHTKLYFPKSDYKWYSNCTENDIFGYHRMGQYLFSEDRSIFITSSAKDELILNYYTQANTIGLQGETVKTLPEFLLNSLKYFDEIYIWLDADSTGIKETKYLEKYLSNIFPTKFIKGIYHNIRIGKDIADISQNFNLNDVLNQLIC